LKTDGQATSSRPTGNTPGAKSNPGAGPSGPEKHAPRIAAAYSGAAETRNENRREGNSRMGRGKKTKKEGDPLSKRRPRLDLETPVRLRGTGGEKGNCQHQNLR